MTEKIRAAQYVRMSTEHQQYSTENQADAIREYAAKRDIEIVRRDASRRTSPSDRPRCRLSFATCPSTTATS